MSLELELTICDVITRICITTDIVGFGSGQFVRL